MGGWPMSSVITSLARFIFSLVILCPRVEIAMQCFLISSLLRPRVLINSVNPFDGCDVSHEWCALYHGRGRLLKSGQSALSLAKATILDGSVLREIFSSAIVAFVVSSSLSKPRSRRMSSSSSSLSVLGFFGHFVL